MEGGIGSPQPGAETLPSDGPGASCCTFRQSCQRRCDAATPSPVGPGGLSAQLHVRARALLSPVPSLPDPPVDEPFLSSSVGSSSDGAGGIRTHGLELMRLARTAAPLPRGALPGESEDLVGRIRTCDLRRPKSVGWPVSPTTSCLFVNVRACTRLGRRRAASPPGRPGMGDLCAGRKEGARGGTWGSPTQNSPAGIEPAARGVEALCSSAELRGDRRPWNRTTLHRRIRAAPAQSACRRRVVSRREDSNLRPPPSQGGARIR